MASAPDADWLDARFAARGGGAPRLVRAVTAPVWSDARALVAKWHADPAQAGQEAAVASRYAAAGHPAARCLDVEPAPGGGALTWWRHLVIVGPAHPVAAARWLRRAHDHADPSGLPHAQLTLPTVTPLPEAVELHRRLAPWLRQAREVADQLPTDGGEPALVHGDANPTNLVTTADGVVGLDFGAAGAGPRVVDVATVLVLAGETGTADRAAVLAGYRPHPDVTDDLLRAAALLVAVSRAATCLRVPGWLGEGYERLAALESGAGYRFGAGNGPK